MKTELLSPAKNKETAFAAIDCGADAVYIGAPAFGARHNASNSLEDIGEVVEYAHKFWAKVFVTVNTILTDSELKEAVDLVQKLDKIGVDAVIIQDFGLLDELMKLKLSISIHMSTQCDNRDSEKVKFFSKLGVQRVVLARELSTEQIRKIHEENPEIELECFVHGALCVSYSGQCYLSQYIGGRSANRGECAQPCRKKYSVIDDKGNIIAKDIYALCLKDFNASSHIKEMADAGVYSYKIEGRLKDVGFVKNITAYYRQLLDMYSEKSSSGKSVYSFKPNPEKSFNRGFTDYFLEKRGECYNLKSPKSCGEYLGKVIRCERNFVTIDTNKNIYPQDGLCYYSENGLEGFLVNRIDKDALYANREIKIPKGTKVYRNVDVRFEKELLTPVKRQIGVNISFMDNVLYLKDEDNVEVQISLSSTEKAQNQVKMNETFEKQISKTGESDFYVTDLKIDSDVPFMPISRINELRRTAFEILMNKRLENYPKVVQKELKYTRYYKDIDDYHANVHNKNAENFYEKCGCKISEYSMETAIPKHTAELMRTKHCIKYALNMCKSPKQLFLKDEFGKTYPLKFDCSNCEMAILHN